MQTKEEFEKRVKAWFGKAYAASWREALACVAGFGRETLLSREEFFGKV